METMAYIGTKPCGCVVAAVVDNPLRRKIVANAVRDIILDGLTVSRVTAEYVRLNFTLLECPHEPTQKPLFEVQL